MRRLVAIGLMAWLAVTPAAAEAPRVVATIAPLHSLIAGVMYSVGEPRLLVPGALSEHTYAMKPSDAKALAEADLVVLVGGGLERFLDKPLTGLRGKSRIVEWLALPGVHPLPQREGTGWEQDHHDHSHHGATEQLDPHLWLVPDNAVVLVTAVAEQLAALDPGGAAVYAANAARLRQRLAELDADLDRRLASASGKPFLVFHDGYQYFERRYRLRAIGAVAFSPERAPGAKHIAALQARIRQGGVACVFREPQFEPKLVEMLTAGTSARVGVLDGLGANLPPGPDLYFRLLDRLSVSVLACLD